MQSGGSYVFTVVFGSVALVTIEHFVKTRERSNNQGKGESESEKGREREIGRKIAMEEKSSFTKIATSHY